MRYEQQTSQDTTCWLDAECIVILEPYLLKQFSYIVAPALILYQLLHTLIKEWMQMVLPEKTSPFFGHRYAFPYGGCSHLKRMVNGQFMKQNVNVGLYRRAFAHMKPKYFNDDNNTTITLQRY